MHRAAVSSIDDDVISPEDDVMVADEAGEPGFFKWAESLWVESGCGCLATVSVDGEGVWPLWVREELATCCFAGGSWMTEEGVA